MPVNHSTLYDCFVSHASEDKAAFVEPLVTALQAKGLAVWFDAQQIRLGDDLRAKMEEGLRSSRFGVVVASPSFNKYWPEMELSALFTQEWLLGEKRILPVVHGMTPKELVLAWPMLASKAAAFSTEGVEAVADKIAAAVGSGVAVPPRQASGLYGVPYRRSVRFVGRDEAMRQLGDLLGRADAVSVSAAIEGLAGIGKTELALQLVHQLGVQGRFPGGIYWFDAEDPDLTTAWGTTMADALAIPEGPAIQRAQLALHTVSQKKASALIVLDNVESWNQDGRPRPLPEGVHLRILITTRQRSLGQGAFQRFELGILAEPYDRQLLHEVAGKDLSQAPGHGALLDHLGGHALALELAGAFLSEYPEETPATYLEALTRGEDRNTEVSDLVRYRKTVHQAFETLWKRLDEDIQEAWRLAACFEAEFASPALADAVGLKAQSRRALRRLHLIETDPKGRWRLHRLTRDFGRRAHTAEVLEAARKAFVVGCMEFAEQLDGITGAMIYLPDRPHLDAALELAPTCLDNKDPRLTAFQNRIAQALYSAADYSTAEALFREGLATNRKNLGEDHPTIAMNLSNLAQLLQATNRLAEAEPLMRRALAIFVASLGQEHPNSKTVARNLEALLADLAEQSLPASSD